jgi:hypothetical protein
MTLKVIGAGFGRTGTLSLKVALEQLGFGPCYHMVEVFPKPEAPAQWIAALDGAPDWEAIFAGYGCTVDWPAAHFWRDLMDYYPDAKIILSVRDTESWFASTQATIFSPRLVSGDAAAIPPHILEMLTRIALADVGGSPADHDACIAAFERHNAEVTKTVPADRLLVFESSQGWAPLCHFLNVAVPDAPYPRANSQQEFQSHSTELMQGGPNR